MEDSMTLQYVPKQEMDDDANLFNTSIHPPYSTGISNSTISSMHPNDHRAINGHPMVSSMHPAGLSSTPSNPWGHSSAPHHPDGYASANAYGYPLDDRASYVAQSQTGPVQDAMNGVPTLSSGNPMSLQPSTVTLPLTSATISNLSRPTSTLHSPVHEGFGSIQHSFGPEGYNRQESVIRNDSFPRTDSFPRIDMLSKNESLARARSRALSYSGPYGLPGQTQQVSGFHTSPTEYAPQILPPLHTQQLGSPYHSQAPSPISQHPPPTHALSPLHHQAMLSQQQQVYHSQTQPQPMVNHIPHPQNHTHSSAFYFEEGGQLSNAPQGAGVNSSGHPHLYTPPTSLTSAASAHVQPSSAAALSSSAVIDATANLTSVTPGASSSSAIGGSSASTSGSPASITAVNNASPSAFAGSNSFHASGMGSTVLGASSGTGTPPGMGTSGLSAAAPPPPVVPLSGVATPTSALSPTSAATVMSTATSSLNSSLPPPIPPLNASIGSGGPPSIPRSMSLNSIPSSGTRSGASTPFHIASGRATPSGILGPSPGSGSIPPPSRLGRMGVPSIMIPAPNLSMSATSLNSAPVATNMYVDPNQPYQFTHQDYMYGPGSTVVSPSTPMILSSLLRGSASGPGTASNGGSVPLTPINDDGVHNFDYHLSTRMNGLDMGSTPSSMGGMVGSGMHTTMVGGMNEMPMGGMHVTMNGGLVHDDMDGIEEDEDEDDDDMHYSNSANPNVLTMASRSRSTSALNMALSNGSTTSLVGGGSPRRSNVSGVERTQKKRRSATIAAGPSAAAVGSSRSRSGTLIGGNLPPTIIGANGLPIPASMMGMGGVMGNPALAFSPLDSIPPTVSNGVVGPQSTQLNPSLGMPNNGTNGVGGVTVPAGVGVGGQANSPLAMKELSASMKTLIEGYLLRYLNYLCMNPNAKDRMGHQIHQMYTARRIQRYEQLYGWRPLKFRIEAFVNGFVDLLTAKGLSQDVTMKIPHYLNNSKLFSRFNESGNRMKSQGQTIWRVRARCRTEIAAMDPAAAAAAAGGQSSSQHSSPAYQVSREDAGLMMAPLPLLWDFVPYERCIVGQPPLAIVGTAWQWNMKVHDHWTPRKKVTWNLVSSNSAPSRTGSSPEMDPSSSPSASSSASNSLPAWLALQGSKLKGTPTQPGVYPISIEATFQEDNDPEPVVVRGNFTIQVSKAIGAYKTKVPVAPEGLIDSPPEVGGDGYDADDLQGGSGNGEGSLSGGPSMTQMAYGMPQGDASRTLYFSSYSYSYVH